VQQRYVVEETVRRFRLDICLDAATMRCPCGSYHGTDDDGYDEWKVTHASHTDDDGASRLEVNDPTSWSKCFAGPCPEPTVKP
jgi:hypothetical protein